MKRLKFLMMTPCRVNVGSSSQIYTRSVFPFLATAYPDEGERVLVGVIFKEGYFSLLCYFLLNETFLGLSSPLLTQQVDRRKRGWGERKGERKKTFTCFSLSLSLTREKEISDRCFV
jgi:hypothetical protein